MPLNKVTKKTLKVKKSLKGLKINKRIKKKNTKKIKLFKKTRGSRNSKVHNKKIYRNKNTKNTKKLSGGGYVGIRLIINNENPINLEEIQPTESVESILRSFDREGKINGLFIDQKLRPTDHSKLTLDDLNINDGSIIRVELGGDNNMSKYEILMSKINESSLTEFINNLRNCYREHNDIHKIINDIYQTKNIGYVLFRSGLYEKYQALINELHKLSGVTELDIINLINMSKSNQNKIPLMAAARGGGKFIDNPDLISKFMENVSPEIFTFEDIHPLSILGWAIVSDNDTILNLIYNKYINLGLVDFVKQHLKKEFNFGGPQKYLINLLKEKHHNVLNKIIKQLNDDEIGGLIEFIRSNPHINESNRTIFNSIISRSHPTLFDANDNY
jgi:hypothetical protein